MKKIEKLIESKNWKERLIGVRLSSIEQVLQVAKTEENYSVCKVIVKRLEENKKLDIVKEAYGKLANSKSPIIREFVAKNAEFKLVLQMAKVESIDYICETIVKRLEENKNLDMIKEAYNKLANSKSPIIREFVADNAEFKLVLQMAKDELNEDVCEAIVERLEENKELDMVKEAYNKLANSKSPIIREFVADNAEFKLVLQMAKTEFDRCVCKVIVERLEENKNLDMVKEAYNKLANSKSSIIREFVVENAKFELVLQMAKNELNYDVCKVIVNRLEENKDLDIVKESYSKLAYSKSAVIRKFVLGSAEFDIVANIINKELKSKNNFYSDEIIELMYHNPNYIKATSDKKIELLGSIELEYLIDVAVYERDEKILLWIYKKIK